MQFDSIYWMNLVSLENIDVWPSYLSKGCKCPYQGIIFWPQLNRFCNNWAEIWRGNLAGKCSWSPVATRASKPIQNVGPLGGPFGSTVISKKLWPATPLPSTCNYILNIIYILCWFGFRANGSLIHQTKKIDTHLLRNNPTNLWSLHPVMVKLSFCIVVFLHPFSHTKLKVMDG